MGILLKKYVFILSKIHLVSIKSFGTNASVTPPFDLFLDNAVKIRITSHGSKQLTMRNNIQSTTSTGINVAIWARGKTNYTLHCQCIVVESI